ncbi:MAG TPA: aspartate--tRNA ligase [Acidobacteriota bacterium]|nr:aspartate--tRNA ligase [Acidobacteriota bacterium]
MRRTHCCGEISVEQVGAQVCLQGWIWHRRDLGGLIFVDLRDRAGSIQCVLNPKLAPEAHATAGDWRPEYVVEVRGVVVDRSAETINPAMLNGDVEVRVESVTTISASETPPFLIEEDGRASEELRLRERFLDLRRPPLQEALALRHRLAMATRNLLDDQGFLEIETPMLTRSTPEGARDYLVPSRVQPGSFYALPQSPQLFKQLLMVSGFDRYFQIVRCFRDEDLRADRQPEFTQIDVEMSFVDADDVRAVAESLMMQLLAISGHEVEPGFPQLEFREVINRFGSDRPDMRYGHELVDVTEQFAGSGFRAFAEVASSGGAVKALRIPGAASWARARFDKLTDRARECGAKGLVWAKRADGEVNSPIAKFLDAGVMESMADAAALEDGDGVVLVGDEWELAATTVGTLRSSLAKSEGWIGAGLRFLWVNEFPLLERTAEAGRLAARHHPFTAPVEQDLDRLESDPLSVRAQSYDLVLNGVELGGGSIRIHRGDVQERVFAALGVDDQEAREKFGFLLRALRFGAPPHGGIALGFDRIVMMMAGRNSLRDVIAFPKTTRASDLLTEAPGPASAEQLEDLCIRVQAPSIESTTGDGPDESG